MALLSVPTFRDWGLTLLDLVFPEPPYQTKMPEAIEPPFCEHCGERYQGDITTTFTCPNCAGRAWHFCGARAQYPFKGAVREAVLGFKYNEQFYHRKALTRWLVEGYDHHYAGQGDMVWSGVVPVPLYRLRRRERGFNQAEELARGLSRQRGLPLLDCLTRTRETGQQTKLDREERWRNLKGAFELRGGFDVRGQNLLLIDDVFTTGATSEGCAQVLHKAGAGIIGVLTVARG